MASKSQDPNLTSEDTQKKPQTTASSVPSSKPDKVVSVKNAPSSTQSDDLNSTKDKPKESDQSGPKKANSKRKRKGKRNWKKDDNSKVIPITTGTDITSIFPSTISSVTDAEPSGVAILSVMKLEFRLYGTGVLRPNYLLLKWIL